MLKLYYNPGSCSLASHAALAEAGLPFEVELVDLTKDIQHSPEYRAKNPFGRVPALEIDGEILTENVAILNYVAGLVPEKQLIPAAGLDRARAIEWMALLSSTIHVAFRPIFRPNRLATTEEGQRDVSLTGLQFLNAVLQQVDQRLDIGPFALGDTFSLCDPYLFVFAMWSKRPILSSKLDPLPNLHAFGDRLSARPSVGAALKSEGLSWS